MDICRQEHLHQIDLLAPAEKKITDREYHAKRRGQKKLDERNRQIAADGLTPRKTVFQTQKDFLRSAIEDVATISNSQEEFQRLLMEKYRITFKNSRGRFSYLHPERSKYITGRMLSTRYEEDYLLKLFEENAKEKEHSADGKAPSMKFLKSEKEQLLQKKTQAQKSYHYYRDYKKTGYCLLQCRCNFRKTAQQAERKAEKR